MKSETKITYPDYKKIHEESCCIDCIITESDFDTNQPNPRRIDYMIKDIDKYLKYKNEEV